MCAINIPSLQIGRSTGITLINTFGEDPIMVSLYDDGWAGLTDSDFDNGIIAHEYGHGISNRLTGESVQAAGCLGKRRSNG